MTEIERETKLSVRPDDYRRILAMDPSVPCATQLNVYLHDPARITNREGYFRARFETGRDPVATLKIQAGWRGDVREMIEVEGPLSEMGPDLFPWPRRFVTLAANVPDEFMRHFRQLGITHVRRLGWMRNRRCRMVLPGLGGIEVDRTRLPGGEILHEVEIEEPDPERHEALVNEVRRLAPSAVPSRVGKFSRFLEAVGLAQAGG